MSAWARPNIECICIRKTPWIEAVSGKTTVFGPHYNQRLTIARVVSDAAGVWLFFDDYPLDAAGYPPLFPVQFFRPVYDLPADIALFAQHLISESEPA